MNVCLDNLSTNSCKIIFFVNLETIQKIIHLLCLDIVIYFPQYIFIIIILHLILQLPNGAKYINFLHYDKYIIKSRGRGKLVYEHSIYIVIFRKRRVNVYCRIILAVAVTTNCIQFKLCTLHVPQVPRI